MAATAFEYDSKQILLAENVMNLLMWDAKSNFMKFSSVYRREIWEPFPPLPVSGLVFPAFVKFRYNFLELSGNAIPKIFHFSTLFVVREKL